MTALCVCVCDVCHENKRSHPLGQETSREQSLLGSEEDVEQARPLDHAGGCCVMLSLQSTGGRFLHRNSHSPHRCSRYMSKRKEDVFSETLTSQVTLNITASQPSSNPGVGTACPRSQKTPQTQENRSSMSEPTERQALLHVSDL